MVHRIVQATQQYNVSGADAQFVLKYDSGERQTFTSLEKFKQVDHSAPHRVVECNVSISFLLATPGVGKYQNYRINIKLYGAAVTSTNFIRGYHSYDDNSPTQFSIEYVDYVVAQSMISVFESWLGTVEKLKIKRPPRWIENLDSEFHNLMAILGFTATLAISFGAFVHQFRESLTTSVGVLGFAYLSLCISVIVGFVLYVFTESFVYAMWPQGNYPFIVITKGDQRVLDEILVKELNRFKFWRRVFASTLSGTLVALLGGMIASYLGITRP
jgi:hypothetical protein